MATNKESILYPEKINNLVQRPVLHWGDLYQMEKEGCLSPDNPNIIRASRILGFNIWEIIKQAREKINSQDPRNNLTERVNQSVELFRILTLIPSLRENLQLPNKKDLSFKSRIELEITETSFLAAIYFWYYQEGGQRTLEEAVPHPRAFTEYGLFKAAEKALCLISDSTERTMVYISRKAGVDCAESVAILRDYFKEFDWDISTTPEEKQKSKFSLRKRPKDLPGVLKAITGLTILLGSLTGSGRVDQKTLRTALILKEAIATANSFAEGPTNPHEENKPSSSLTSSKTDILSNDQEWFRNAITQTTTPLEIPPQITVTGQDGETGPAPEISIEKNEAFHVVEPGEWLSKIVKEYWYKKDAEGPMVARFTRVLLMINPHLGNDPNKIEVGKRVFLYPEQMKGKFAEVLAFLLEGKGKLEDLEELIKDLAIPTIGSQDELGPASKKGEWIIYENKEQLPLEAIVRLYFGAFGEKSLALINRINHMRMDGQGVIPWLVLPPEGWWVFQIENNPFPPAIAIPQISTDLQAPIRQPEVKKNSPEPKATVTTASKESTYTVKKGDTLLAIAQRFGTTVSAIAGANAIQNPNKIFAGQKLEIPGQGEKKNDANVYQELPEELKKYLDGYWKTWEEIPEELRKWLIGIIATETSAQHLPSWAILAVMRAEQLGGFRLSARLSTASAVEPLGITQGWELSFFGTNGERFDFRKQVEMVSERLVANGLGVDTLIKEGEKSYREKLEIYLCKHLAGEGRNCAPDSADRNIPASPGSTMSVQEYVDIGSQTAKDLTGSQTLQKDVKEVIADKALQETDQKLGVTPPKKEIEAAIGQNDPKAVVSGEKPLETAVKEAVEKQIEAAGQKLEKEVKKIVQGENVSKQDEPKAPVALQTKSITSPEPTNKPEAEKPKIFLPPKEELSRIQTSAQKSLCRSVSAEEIVTALKVSDNDSEKAIQSFQSSPEAIVCQQAKESLKKANGKEPLTSQAREVAEEAMKVWNGQEPNQTQIETAKKRVEEILGVQKKESPQESKVFDNEKKVHLPQVGQPYQSGNLKLRDTVSTRSGELNDYEVHGNKDYTGVPSWLGQDFQTDSTDKTVVSPIDGVAESGWDPNAGYYISIRGTGIYEGLHVRIIHLAGKTADGQTNRGQIIGQEGPQAHLHIITLWGDGGFNASAKDVPFSLLLPEDQKPESKYQAGNYTELYSLGNEYFNWFELK